MCTHGKEKPMEKQKFAFEWLDVKIALGLGLCMLLYFFVPRLQLLSACTAALMCMQDAPGFTMKSGLTRTLTTIFGGLLAVLVVLADNALGSYPLFTLMSMAGLLLTIWVCRLAQIPPVMCRIGGVTFILVVVVAAGEARVLYALHRVLATVCGAVIAWGVSGLFAALGLGRPQGNKEGR